MRLFDANGQPTSDEITVHQTASEVQPQSEIAVLENGNIAVTWHSDRMLDGNLDVFARVFSPTGQALGDEIDVDPTDAPNEDFPAIAALADGGFAAVWTADDGSSLRVFVQKFDAGGVAVGDKIPVEIPEFSSTLQGNYSLYAPRIVGRSDGGFVVAGSLWDIRERESGLFVRMYDADGAVIVPPSYSSPGWWTGYRTSTTDIFWTSSQESRREVDIAATIDGGFVVSYSRDRNGVGDDETTTTRRFDALGVGVDSFQYVNDDQSFSQENDDSRVTVLPNGQIAVTYESGNEGGSERDVFVRILRRGLFWHAPR